MPSQAIASCLTSRKLTTWPISDRVWEEAARVKPASMSRASSRRSCRGIKQETSTTAGEKESLTVVPDVGIETRRTAALHRCSCTIVAVDAASSTIGIGGSATDLLVIIRGEKVGT